MLQHLQMLFIFTKRLKVSMICGSQNMNSIMRYNITSGFGSLLITVLSNYRLIVQPQTSVGNKLLTKSSKAPLYAHSFAATYEGLLMCSHLSCAVIPVCYIVLRNRVK